MSPFRAYFASPVGPLVAEADAEGALVSLGRARVEYPERRGGLAVFDALDAQLAAYWGGEPAEFSLSLNPPASPFQARVWAALRGIPWGRTITYSELARRVGSNPRAVGQANGANPIAIVIPCHRVIGVDGSLVGYAGGLDMKRALLKLERCLLF